MFLCLYMVSTTEVSEIFKLPVLWQHFKEHKDKNSRISFISFLKMHYFNGNPKDADYARDMQLPFKSPMQCQVTTTATILPFVYSEVSPPVYNYYKVNIPSEENLLSPGFLSFIWQPPRA